MQHVPCRWAEEEGRAGCESGGGGVVEVVVAGSRCPAARQVWVLGRGGARQAECERHHLPAPPSVEETKMTIQPKKASSMQMVQATEGHAAGKQQRSSRWQ